MADTTKRSDGSESIAALDDFFQLLGTKVSDESHRRLLRAARSSQPLETMNEELARIAEEVVRET